MKKALIISLAISLLIVGFVSSLANASTKGDIHDYEHDWVLIDDQSGMITQYTTVSSCEYESFPHSHYRLLGLRIRTYQCTFCGITKEVETQTPNSEWICSLHDWGKSL